MTTHRPTTTPRKSAARSPRAWPNASLFGAVVILLFALVPLPSAAQTVLAPETALIRIVHASPDAPALDVYVDDQLLTDSAAFGSATPYLAVATGKHDLEIVPAGGDPKRQVLATTEISFEAESFQLVAIQNYLNAITLSVYPEDVSQLDEQGYARVRLIHLVPDANEISLLGSEGGAIVDGVIPLRASNFEAIQAGSRELAVQPERQDTVGAIPVSMALLPNTTYDLVVIGQLQRQTIQVLPLTTATDQPCGQFLGIGGPASICLRFLNASPTIPTVDLYVGDDPQLVANGLSFGVASPVLSIPSGEVELRIVPTGSPPDPSLADESFFADDGDGVLVIASGLTDHVRLDEYDDLDAPLGGQQARVSVIHRADDAGTVDVGINGQPLVQAILETEQSEDRLLPAGAYIFTVTSNTDGTPLGQSDTVTMTAGTSYQIVLVGDTEFGVVAIIVASVPVPTDTVVPLP